MLPRALLVLLAVMLPAAAHAFPIPSFPIGERSLIPAAVSRPVAGSDGRDFLVADLTGVFVVSGQGVTLRDVPLPAELHWWHVRKVVWDGDVYLVQYDTTPVYGQRRMAAFRRDGTLLWHSRPWPAGESFAVDGDGIVGVIEDRQTPYVVRLDREGNQLTAPLQLAERFADPATVTVTSAGVVLTWRERDFDRRQTRVVTRLFDRAGSLGPRNVVATLPFLSRDELPPPVATDGSTLLVAWTIYNDPEEERRNPRPNSIAGRLLDPFGQPAADMMTLAGGYRHATQPRLIFAGGLYRLLYENRLVDPAAAVRLPEDTPRSMAVDLTPLGTRAGPEVFPGGTEVVVAANGERMLLTATGTTLRTAPASAPIEVLIAASPSFIRRVPSRARTPAAVWTGHQYMVAWMEDGAGGMQLRVARVDAAGSVAGVSELDVPAAGSLRMATNGGTTVLLWPSQRPGESPILMASRVDANGVFLDGRRMAVSNDFDPAGYSVASDGNDFLLVWRERSTGRVAGSRLSRSGERLDPVPLRISEPASLSDADPVVTFDGEQYVVLWRRIYPVFVPLGISPTGADLFAAAVSPDGVVSENERIAGDGRAWVSRDRPAAASDGAGNVLVSWTNGPGIGVIFRRGQPAREFHLPNGVATLDPASVCWTGAEWLMAAAGHLAAVAPEGTGRWLPETPRYSQIPPHALAGDGSGRALVVWVDGSGDLRGAIVEP